MQPHCVPLLELDHSQAEGISLSAPLQHHQRVSGCLARLQSAGHLALDVSFPGNNIYFLNPKDPYTAVCTSGSSSRGWGTHGQEGNHSTQPQAAATTSRAQQNQRQWQDLPSTAEIRPVKSRGNIRRQNSYHNTTVCSFVAVVSTMFYTLLHAQKLRNKVLL